MSWSYDFGEVKDAAALRKRRSFKIDFGEDQGKPERKAAQEALKAAHAAAVKVLESPVFGGRPVIVAASGQATPAHEPVPNVDPERQFVFEQLTITFTQR